ncbi:hypothetical protein DSM106972_041640 [Dulcicalothrix desertica PCC 7102]|uniref:N-acetyltransferase domain-containing protein n=1 Tax=Dulcicalothrix desertica PCC 7102 TaxID=232991 RepID=A0A433VER5_9CYAN|nr:hypothetical protein [Dulcicalothrix desertica]RUT04595.1 hypothetical protein DSM106972_041640 [Dulcicalothrix desertica PCC 7102]TWH42602.1 hypothetical protein CAL7102_06275 [Dulcicalothrix desertica PCC 7102]
MQYKSEIFREFTNEIAIYMTPRPAIDIFETESFINESIIGLAEGSNLQLVIIKKDTQEFLGCTGIHNLNAKAREKQIKGWLREKKIALIESINPTWKDLSDGWYDS